jgi:hypothetical protein
MRRLRSDPRNFEQCRPMGFEVLDWLQVPQPNTLNPPPSTLNPSPSTLNPQPCTLNPKPSTLHPQPETLNSTPSTLHQVLSQGGPTELSL